MGGGRGRGGGGLRGACGSVIGSLKTMTEFAISARTDESSVGEFETMTLWKKKDSAGHEDMEAPTTEAGRKLWRVGVGSTNL